MLNGGGGGTNSGGFCQTRPSKKGLTQPADAVEGAPDGDGGDGVDQKCREGGGEEGPGIDHRHLVESPPCAPFEQTDSNVSGHSSQGGQGDVRNHF